MRFFNKEKKEFCEVAHPFRPVQEDRTIYLAIKELSTKRGMEFQ